MQSKKISNDQELIQSDPQVSAFAKIMEHGIMVDQFEEEKIA